MKMIAHLRKALRDYKNMEGEDRAAFDALPAHVRAMFKRFAYWAERYDRENS